MDDSLQGLIEWYEHISPESVAQVGRFYAADARFSDPFNELQGVAAIERVFRHMFAQVEQPRFVVSDVCTGPDQAMLRWEFSFRQAGALKVVPGATHLKFDSKGLVSCHVDYWDPARHLFSGIPVLGFVLRAVYRRLRAP